MGTNLKNKGKQLQFKFSCRENFKGITLEDSSNMEIENSDSEDCIKVISLDSYIEENLISEIIKNSPSY